MIFGINGATYWQLACPMMTLEQQREHYAAVRRRIAAAGRPEPKPEPKKVATILPFRRPQGETIYCDPIRITYPDLSKYHKAYVRLIIEVATKHGIAPIDLLNNNIRLAVVLKARQELWFIMNDEWGWSYKRIGQVAARDRTTIIHGINKHLGIARKDCRDSRR